MDEAQASEARRTALAVMLAVIDGRDSDLPQLLADADRDTLTIAVGGLAIAVGAALGELHPDRRAEIREYLAAWALRMAGT
jgi:hypothetical protein